LAGMGGRLGGRLRRAPVRMVSRRKAFVPLSLPHCLLKHEFLLHLILARSHPGLTCSGKVIFRAGGSNATVVTADVKAGNSIVHVIDNVLLPSSRVLEAATA
jgi:hypothetical protein